MASSTALITLGIPEILSLIIGKLRLDHPSLAQMTRVSTGFHEASIRYLWSGECVDDDGTEPYGLVHLLNLLPKDVVGQQGEKWILKRPPQELEWRRFRHYAVHTTSITFRTGSYAVPLVTALANQENPAFPRLSMLIVRAMESTKRPSTEWMRLVGPSLRQLHVYEGYPSYHLNEEPSHWDTVNAFIQCLAIRTPRLLHLHVGTFPEFHANLVDAFCRILRLLPLKTLHWSAGTTLPDPILTTIATHPTISNVSLCPLSHWPGMDIGPCYFPSLTQLRLTCKGDVPNTTKNDPKVSLAFFKFCSQIPTSLTRAHITFAEQSVLWEHLRPLLSCHSISELIIWASAPVAGFNDEAVEELASCLLQLEVLQFCAESYRGPPYTGVTLYGLAPLAQLSSHLVELHIGITTRMSEQERGDSAVLEPSPFTPSALRSLSLYQSEVNTGDGETSFWTARDTVRAIAAMWPLLPMYEFKFGWGGWGQHWVTMQVTQTEMGEVNGGKAVSGAGDNV